MMKKYLISKDRSFYILLVVVAFSLLIRFYNFPNRVTFWSEQARSLMVSESYIHDKFSLLGQEYFRVDSRGHTIFSGAIFNYSLVPIILIFKENPIAITSFFALLNVVTGIVVYYVVQKIFDKNLALVSTIVFLFNDFMIYHSLFIWNYNYLPLVGILTYFSIHKKKPFLVGLLCGIGISLQILFVPITVVLLAYLVWISKRKFYDFALFLMGSVLGNLPMVLFDLRHDFYQTRTLMQYVLDTLAGKSGAGINYYYFLPFWPLLAIVAGWVILRVFKFSKALGMVFVGAYVLVNIFSSRIDFKKPTGMPNGLKVNDIDRASGIIANDINSNFNVSEVLDFDKRAYVLRYFLQYKYGKLSDGVEEYPKAEILYVLSPENFDYRNTEIWEIKANWPYRVSKLTEVGSGYQVDRLEAYHPSR